MNNNHETVRTDTQFSVFLVNKPGVLARVVQQLASNKINILAMSIMETSEHGVLRLVAQCADSTRKALRALDVPTSETVVVSATMPNRPGALADIVERLASEHINVHYAYCTSGAPGGRTLGIFKLSNVPKAIQVMTERKPRRRPEPAAIRGQTGQRRA